MARKKRWQVKGETVLMAVGGLFLAAAAVYPMVTMGIPGLITGGSMFAAPAMAFGATRLPFVNGAVARRVGDGVQLPRRKLYIVIVALAGLVLGTGFMAVAAVERAPGRSTSGRYGDPYVALPTIGFMIFVAGVAALVAILCGRGSVRFTETDVQRRPLLWRRRCFAWDQLQYEWQGDKPGEKAVLVLQGPSFQSRVEIGGQAWPADRIDAALAEFASAGPAGRRAMIDSGWTGPQGHRQVDQPKSRRKPTTSA